MTAEGFSPSGLKKYPHLRFMPRFGFAYRPFGNDKWAVRGGVGLYNINMLGSSFYSLTGTIQAYTQQFANSYNSGNTHAASATGRPQIYCRVRAAMAAPTATAATTSAPPTALTGKTPTPNSGAWAPIMTSAPATRRASLTSVPRLITLSGRRMKIPCRSPQLSRPSITRPSARACSPNWGRINDARKTGYANEGFITRCSWKPAIASSRVCEYHSGLHLGQGVGRQPGAVRFRRNRGRLRAAAASSPAKPEAEQRHVHPRSAHADFGNVFGRRRLRWNTTALYDLPFGRGKMFGRTMNRLTDLAVGGWRLSSILTVQTGPYETPYFPDGEGDPSGTGSGSGLDGEFGNGTGSFDGGHRAQHPDQVAGVTLSPIGKNRYNWINGAAFACPGEPTWTIGTSCTTGAGFNPATGAALSPNPLPIGRFGNSEVGSVEGPGLVNLLGRFEQELPDHRTAPRSLRRHLHQRSQPHQPRRSKYGRPART